MRKFILFIIIIFWASTANAATSWYVDSAATGSNNGTSWANAWNSFSNIQWSSINAGDTIYISGGSVSRTYTTPLSIGKSGSSGSPITIKAGQDTGHNGTVIIDGGGGSNAMVNFGNKQYVTLDGQYNGARHIVVQNNSLSGDNKLIYGIGSTSSLITGNHLTYLEIKDSGSGVGFIYGQLTEIDHCYIHNICDEVGIDLDGSLNQYSGDMSQHNLYDQGALIHDNIIQVNNSGVNSGIGPDAIQGTHGLTIYNNVIYGATGTVYGGQHGDGVQEGGSYYKIYNNFIYGMCNSIIHNTGQSTNIVGGYQRIWNNVFAESAGQSNSHGFETNWSGQSSLTRMTDIRFYNNTFVDFTGYNAIRMEFPSTSITADNIAIRNNIFYDSGSSSYQVIYITTAAYTLGVGVVIDYNNINAGSSGNTTVYVHGSNYNSPNLQSAAPVFASYTKYNFANNYHLASSSTADFGLGANLSTYFVVDKDGNARPATGAWDIGAYLNPAAIQRPLPPVLNLPVLK